MLKRLLDRMDRLTPFEELLATLCLGFGCAVIVILWFSL